MQTPEFDESLESLIQLAKKEQVALMCAEAVPWRCHRSLIADALVAREFNEHIVADSQRRSLAASFREGDSTGLLSIRGRALRAERDQLAHHQ
jgi:uncharacterized protein (DUF488 family)